MEISKLTICRQDVIVVSDTETQSNEPNSIKKKKSKRKTECVRNVKLTKMTVNRIVPNCYRQKCRNAQHYHRRTYKNMKYQNHSTSSVSTKDEKSKAKTKHCELDTNDNINHVLNRELYSPITVESSTDTYENISSCSFNVQSSDSDEIEDLIKLTRERMKNENNNQFIKSAANATGNDQSNQNISPSDESFDNSIHSMDTVVLCSPGTIPSPRIRPECHDRDDLKQHNNNIMNTKMFTSHIQDGNLLKKKVPSLSSQESKASLSPLYEISGKVFMEHYLNTSFI